jgi:transcriptional regulator with XRE-family HTH domain
MTQNVTSIDQYVINAVRQRRLKAGLSQAALAAILGVSPGFVGKVESPKYAAKYNLAHINTLSLHFGCSPQTFLPRRPISVDRKK